MLERRSALAGFVGAAEQPGTDGVVGLRIGEITGWSLAEIGIYPSKYDDAEKAIKEWLGLVPERVATPGTTPHGLLIRTGPLSFWLLGESGDLSTAALAALPEASIATIDLSSSRTRLYIEGARATDALLKGIPIDLALESFPVGSVALTGVHHTPVVLYRTAADRFELFAMRTFALTVLEWLTDAAMEFGYRIRHSRAADQQS